MGLRQGENLSPVLFSIFLNDLQIALNDDGVHGIELKDPYDQTEWLKLALLLYADDTIIFSDSPLDFQKSLDSFHRYCEDFKLVVNLSKTKVMIFGARKFEHRFTLGNSSLEIVQSYKYLGVTFSSNGSFLNARKHVASQARKAMASLLQNISRLNLSVDLSLKVFDSTVMPVLLYGSEIFGFENTEILDRVYHDFMRIITQARKSTPLYMLFGELGRYPLLINIKYKIISFWLKIVTGKQQKISFILYRYMLTCNPNTFPWLKYVERILNECGKSDIWINQMQLGNIAYNKQIKHILISQFKQHWFGDLLSNNKSLIYRSIKPDFGIEEYFKKVNKRASLIMFSFRTANHKLPIETGRWDGTQVNDRICSLCVLNAVGSERHYLFDCPYFHQERTQLIGYITANNNNQNILFKNVMCSSSYDDLYCIIKFIEIIQNTFER